MIHLEQFWALFILFIQSWDPASWRPFYANALTVLLQHAGIKVDRQVPFEIKFHGQSIGNYRADMVVESRIVVEIKAGRCIIPQHPAQLLNYLRASRLKVGLLLNFGDTAEFKRVVWTRNPPR